MPTINQLLKKRRTRPKARDRVPALEKSPQKRGVTSCPLDNLTLATFLNAEFGFLGVVV